MNGRVVKNIFHQGPTVPFHSIKSNPTSNSVFRSRMLSGSEMTAAQVVRIDVAIASELQGTFQKRRRQKSTDRFSQWKRCCGFVLYSSGKSLINHLTVLTLIWLVDVSLWWMWQADLQSLYSYVHWRKQLRGDVLSPYIVFRKILLIM